jgi:iron complex outermembrane recepter protein
MNNAIDILAAQATINVCAGGNLAVCQFVVRDPNTGAITQVTSTYQNLTKLHASGYEAVVNYTLDLDKFKLPGRLDFTLNGNYVDDLSTIGATGARTQNVNFTGNPGSVTSLPGVPRWRLDGFVTYANGPAMFTVSGRFIPTGLLDPSKIGPEQAGYSPTLPNSISTNRIDSRVYIDLSGSWKLGTVHGVQSEIFGGVSNLFDTQEPATLRLYGNPLYFDPVGRAFKIGLRIRH